MDHTFLEPGFKPASCFKRVPFICSRIRPDMQWHIQWEDSTLFTATNDSANVFLFGFGRWPVGPSTNPAWVYGGGGPGSNVDFGGDKLLYSYNVAQRHQY